jgi:hypothetical protein
MTSRRQFLGAAAAALSLSAVDETQAATDGGEESAREPLDDTPPDSGEYPQTVSFGAEYVGSVDVPQYSDSMGIDLEVVPFQASNSLDLHLTLGPVDTSIGLEPDEARDPGRVLLEAADEVDAWRAANWDEEMRELYDDPVGSCARGCHRMTRTA